MRSKRRNGRRLIEIWQMEWTVELRTKRHPLQLKVKKRMMLEADADGQLTPTSLKGLTVSWDEGTKLPMLGPNGRPFAEPRVFDHVEFEKRMVLGGKMLKNNVWRRPSNVD